MVFCIVEEYQNKVGVEQPVNIEKLGIAKLSDNDKKNQYMVFNYKYGKDFKEVKKYILMLEKSDNGYFSISNYGFIDDQYNIQIKKLILY